MCFNGETIMRNTSDVGEASRWQIIAALARRGKQLLLPVGDHLRYDLAIDDEGTILRIQCKTGRLRNGAVRFATCSIDARSTRGTTIRQGYRGQVVVWSLLSGQSQMLSRTRGNGRYK
jgi:hypothetical protein